MEFLSVVKQAFKSFWEVLRSNIDDPENMTIKDLRGENEVLTKALSYLSTPAPDVDLLNQNIGPDIRLPRIPLAEFQLYTMRWASVVLRTVCAILKQEIFRETKKDGWDFVACFRSKCLVCGFESEEKIDQCHCGSDKLRGPDVSQKKIWTDFMKEANKADQTGMEVFSEIEDDLNTVDDSYLILLKDYMLNPSSDELWGKTMGMMRGDPSKFRIVANDAGERGGRFFVCPYHRHVVSNQPGECMETTCTKRLHDVHYVETEGGGADPKYRRYFLAGEVIHASKYEPSRLYGISPIFTLWVLARVLILMDTYAENLYEKGRLKGILGISADNMEYVKKWWDETQLRLRQDPHYLPVVAIESGEKGKGKIEFVKLIDSLKDMEYGPAKEMMRNQIGALYGVMPIFQADVSTGTGLNNEGLQMTVVDRSIDNGQSVYHDKFFPKLAMALQVTDWEPRLKPSRETDKMADLQRYDQQLDTARKGWEMGYDVKLTEDGFELSGEAKPYVEPLAAGAGTNFGNFGSQITPSPGAEDEMQPSRPEPQNRLGDKRCPPGQVATPDNPRCHPIESDFKSHNKEAGGAGSHIIVECRKKTFLQEIKETEDPNHEMFWTTNKCHLVGNPMEASRIFFKTEEGIQGFFDVQGYGVRKYKGSLQPVVLFDKLFSAADSIEDGKVYDQAMAHFKDVEQEQSIMVGGLISTTPGYYNPIYGVEEEEKTKDVKKLGDMLAHFSCFITKIKRIVPGSASNYKSSKHLRDWIKDQDPAIRKQIGAAEKACHKAGVKGNPRDSDYPYPPPMDKGLREEDENLRAFKMFRENDESGVSGTGHVASGVVYEDGSVALRWQSDTSSTILFDSVEDFKAIHIEPHGGNHTKLEWFHLEHDRTEVEKLLKAIESGRKVDQAQTKIENEFIKQITDTYEKKLRKLEDLEDGSHKSLNSEVDMILRSMQPVLEKVAFQEILAAYRKGKSMVLNDHVKKMSPPIGTSGGKARMARRLTSIIPEHKIYDEPCAGAGAVILKKDSAEKSYLNDVDQDLILMWKMLQKGSLQELSYLQSKDWSDSNDLWQKLKKQDPATLKDLDRVYRKLFIRKNSYMSNEQSPSFDRRRKKRPAKPAWIDSEKRFQNFAEKLKNVEITSDDYKAVILRTDSPDTFHFIDTPYEDEFAKELVELLPKIKGKYLVTFSDNETLKKAFPKETHVIKVIGQVISGKTYRPERKELLIANYPINVPKDTLFKAEAPVDWESLQFSKPDIQVLRAIYDENPFWDSFANMSQDLSNQLKSIITESYEPPSSGRFQATLRDVNRQYPRGSVDSQGNPYTLKRQQTIVYGRIGKFNLSKTIEKMMRSVQTDVYRLERIARTETTAVTAKGREVAFKERDPEDKFKFDWFGPLDHRTSDTCKLIGAQVARVGKGQGVSLTVLKEIMNEAVEKTNAQWGPREWLPHANCRRVLRRVS